MLLADLGADVIRVDRPGGNAMQVSRAGEGHPQRGRPSVAVNIKDPRGVEVVLQLVEKADS